MKKILYKSLILMIIVVICSIQNVYAKTIITKENLEKSIKEYVCYGKSVTVKIDDSTLSIGGEKLPEDQFEMTDTVIRIILKPEQTTFTKDLVVEYNYVIENNQIKFDTTIIDTENQEEQTLLAIALLPMLYLSVTDLYGVDEEKALEYFIKAGYNSTENSVESEVYSLTISDTSFSLIVNLDKISSIETENPSEDNNDNNNTNNNSNGNNNSGNFNNSNDTTNKEDNTIAPGKLPYTGVNIGLIVLVLVGVMVIVGVINQRKYKDVK